jgi:hypothetical protein
LELPVSEPIINPPCRASGITDLIVAVERARHVNAHVPDRPDPVLVTLTNLADWRDYTNLRIRAVLAYARTAVQPRPYRLIDLADAVGMSISGVRIAFDHNDIRAVADALTAHNNP